MAMEFFVYIPRLLQLTDILKQKSCFLFGPRQTGKSTFIKQTLAGCPTYNLLDSSTLLSLSRSPGRLEQELGNHKIVIIDEIQKLPNLLDEVHKLIEEKCVHFLLTGSSARKLRTGGVNLLGGRARSRHLHPFVFAELQDKFDLNKALQRGTIPPLYFSDAPQEDLEAYAGDYLREEIAAEGLVRSIPSFSRFLEVAALSNGKMINFTEIANDAQVARTTVHEYFQILKDTLIAHELQTWRKTKTRKTLSTSKFYFFDIGVARFLQNRRDLQERSPEYSDAFEAYLFHELKTFVDYTKCGELFYWRTQSGFKVDFIVDDVLAVEVKAKNNITTNDLKGLQALQEEKLLKYYILVFLEKKVRVVDGVTILPWDIFLKQLWGRELA